MAGRYLFEEESIGKIQDDLRLDDARNDSFAGAVRVGWLRVCPVVVVAYDVREVREAVSDVGSVFNDRDTWCNAVGFRVDCQVSSA